MEVKDRLISKTNLCAIISSWLLDQHFFLSSFSNEEIEGIFTATIIGSKILREEQDFLFSSLLLTYFLTIDSIK